ncbi:glycosyltransferase family 2 protein [Plantactinospora sp. S1510]|uniref:Glycosyltransferase family 2 protein n=1 Tax=Plantactinospora alkalitolerans TaxID=2789879 RepID=A0ABS0H2U3_9ACTN|nr:glycosyltransferase family A protein [Plantactinospora alkalitolerans]MBF9132800.1 glycosyltransferase family 2 protein [Plantactinospora alkalitolerans]
MPSAAFVTSYLGDSPVAADYLDRTVRGVLEQTDHDWVLVIVDDASPDPSARDRLRSLTGLAPDRIVVLRQDVNQGQGAGRNLGVRWAAHRGCEFVLFQDADDIAHPRRLEQTRRLFEERPGVDFLYSTFVVIDEQDRPVPVERLTPSVAEILQSHETPVDGPNGWIPIGTEVGYTTLTSTVAVRTPLALAHPFPLERGCEDAHAWLRMSAGGSAFAFLPDTPARYRIPQDTRGSADRSRIGDGYYRRKAEVETDGFQQAMRIAIERGTLDPSAGPDLTARFLRRLAVTLEREGQHALVREIMAVWPVPA